jgi:hypothetical protein
MTDYFERETIACSSKFEKEDGKLLKWKVRRFSSNEEMLKFLGVNIGIRHRLNGNVKGKSIAGIKLLDRFSCEIEA